MAGPSFDKETMDATHELNPHIQQKSGIIKKGLCQRELKRIEKRQNEERSSDFLDHVGLDYRATWLQMCTFAGKKDTRGD